jgi:trehalose/maltose hydrolase-like predicted phosphorylase
MTPRTSTPPAWAITEPHWQPERNDRWESLFTVANGYLGARGFPEEPFDAGPSTPTILVAGLFDPGPDGIPELAPVANVLSAEIDLDGGPLRMAPGRVNSYERVLDMKRGLLRRAFVYRHRGRSTRLEFERFASLANCHLLGQSITITPLDWRGRAAVRFWMGGPGGGPAGRHLSAIHSSHVARDRILLAAQTTGTKTRVAHACRCRSWVRQAAPPQPKHVGEGSRLGLAYEAVLECSQRAVFQRLAATYTSRDPETTSVERCCLEDVRGLDGAAYGVRRRRHVRRWAGRWRRADVAIDGPRDDQQAVRFAVFHLVQACPPRDATVSVAAKGLTGPGYRGHVFWDTELFMLPHFIWTHPGSAHRLLDYRRHTLPGARRKALANGYQGAMFPWESADTGDETCPPYVPGPDGKPVRVLTGELQHHITADIVYACRQYVRATGDDHFRERQLLVLAVETARFWASRVRYNRREGRYEIRDVIGPDEYHVHVDNNAYTNFLAAWNLRLAAEEVARMRAAHPRSRLLRELRIGEGEPERWRGIAAAMFLPVERDGGLWEQHAGFFKLPRRDPGALRRRIAAKTGNEQARIFNRCQVLKQPDVLMLMALFPRRFSRRVRRRNWDCYEPRTDHGSSLSPSVHSIVASDLALKGKAYEYFRRSAFIDLHDTMGNTAAGLHCASLGGTWQAVVRGFLGLQPGEEGPSVRPSLPAAWKAVRTQVMYRKRWYAIEAGAGRASFRPVSDGPAPPPRP